MLIQEEFLKKLRSAFDLNIYEVKIWTALLSRGIATAGELSDISNVPRSRSYDVLESLEKKGFVMMKLGKPIKYIAVQPQEILLRVKGEVKNRAEYKLKILDKVKGEEVFKEIELLYKNGINHVDIGTLSGALKGRSNVYGHLQTMLGNAKKNVTIVTSADGLKRKLDEFKNVLKKLSMNGVKVRIAAPLSDKNKDTVKELSKVAQVKNLEKVNARFIIVDNKEVLFMIANDKEVHENYDGAVWVSTPFFAAALSNLFEQTWSELK